MMPMRYYAMLLHCSANMRPSWRALCKSFSVTPCFHSTGEETKCIFIFELKYKKSADIAMAQISDKDYAKAFADDGRKVVKVGINFSENQRSIEDWVIE